MKKYILCLPFLIFLVSCDAPRRTLSAGNYSSGITDSNNGFNSSGSNGGGSNSGGAPGSDTTTTPGFENCNMTYKYSTIDTSFIVKFALPSTEYQICLIPTYKDNAGASTYLGNPQCLFVTSEQVNKVILGKLVKDRPGYSHLSINGVMIMKKPLTTSYYACMQGYTAWPKNTCPSATTMDPQCSYLIQSCPNGGATSNDCHIAATNYMNAVCTQFKNAYSSAYADIRTK